MAEIDCNGLDEPCVTWTGGVVTRTGPRQYCYFTWNGAETLRIHPAVTMGLFRAITGKKSLFCYKQNGKQMVKYRIGFCCRPNLKYFNAQNG